MLRTEEINKQIIYTAQQSGNEAKVWTESGRMIAAV